MAWDTSWWDGVTNELDDGRGMKLGWYRTEPGRVEISVEDVWSDTDEDWSLPDHVGGGDSAGLAWVPEGYGAIRFQVSGIAFPHPGCWAVTGYLLDDVTAGIVSTTQFLIWVPPIAS